MNDRKTHMDKHYSWDLNTDTNSIWAYQNNIFTAEQCNNIIKLGLSLPATTAHLGQSRTIDTSIRQGRIAFFDPRNSNFEFIFNTLAAAGKAINNQFWGFDIKFMECVQFTCYDNPNDFYTSHMDMGYRPMEVRKLSISVQLSNPDTYQGGDLELFKCGINFDAVPRQQGTIIVFPSYHVHRVTPVTSGARYSLVAWFAGPPFK